MNPHAPPGQKSAQRLGQVERGRFRDRVGRSERQGGDGHRRHVVDDGSAGTGQQRQEGLDDVVRAEEVDGQVLFEHGTIAQVIEECNSGVVDEDIERFDALGSCLNLRRVGHVQGQGRDAPVRVGQGLARAGIHSLRASGECFGDQRLADAAIGAGHQHCHVGDCHVCCSSSVVFLWAPRRLLAAY